MWSILTSRQFVNDAVIIYLTQLNQLARQLSVALRAIAAADCRRLIAAVVYNID